MLVPSLSHSMTPSREGLAGTDITKRALAVVVGAIILTHLVLDPALTVYRLETRGGYELNPLWRGMLRRTPGLVLLAQLPIIAGVAVCYWELVRRIKRETPPWDARLAKGVWYGSILLICWGLFITFHHLWYLAQPPA